MALYNDRANGIVVGSDLQVVIIGNGYNYGHAL